MRYWEIISEEGKIVKGVNTTPDVQPGEMARQGAKLGFTLTPDGLPPVWTGLASFTNAKDTPNSGDPFYDADGTNPKKSAPIVEGAVQIPDHFQKLIRDGHIEVWRAIRAHWGFLNDLYPGDGVGIYWTYNKEFAVAYDASRGGQLFRLHGAIPVASVDWTNTIKVDGSQEYEITAKNGSTITLISIDALDGAGQIIEADVKPGVKGQTYKTAPRNV